jgi:hypothetical protein
LVLTVIRWLSPFWTALRSHRGCSTRRRGAARRCRHNAHEHRRRRRLLFSLPLSLCFFLSPCGRGRETRLELIGETGQDRCPVLTFQIRGLDGSHPLSPRGYSQKFDNHNAFSHRQVGLDQATSACTLALPALYARRSPRRNVHRI